MPPKSLVPSDTIGSRLDALSRIGQRLADTLDAEALGVIKPALNALETENPDELVAQLADRFADQLLAQALFAARQPLVRQAVTDALVRRVLALASQEGSKPLARAIIRYATELAEALSSATSEEATKAPKENYGPSSSLEAWLWGVELSLRVSNLLLKHVQKTLGKPENSLTPLDFFNVFNAGGRLNTQAMYGILGFGEKALEEIFDVFPDDKIITDSETLLWHPEFLATIEELRSA